MPRHKGKMDMMGPCSHGFCTQCAKMFVVQQVVQENDINVGCLELNYPLDKEPKNLQTIIPWSFLRR